MEHSRHLIITVHGIRTFGEWQFRLRALLQQAAPGITVHNYRYGYRSIFALLMPFLRLVPVARFRRWLLHDIQSEEWTRVDIVAHSFGTLLAAQALLGLRRKPRPRVHTILFASSVLRSTFPWHRLLGSCVGRVVNECALNDVPLILSQWFAPFCGMAGRIGFIGMDGDRFVNRYFRCGHSGYFSDDQHMRRWVPILTSEGAVESEGEAPKEGLFSGVRWWLIENAEPVKLAAVVVPLLAALLWVNGLRRTAVAERGRAERQTTEATRQRNLAESERRRAQEREAEANRQRALADRRALNALTAAAASTVLEDAWWDRDDQRAALVARQAYLLNARNGLDVLGSVDRAVRTVLSREPSSAGSIAPDMNHRGMAVSSDGSLLAVAGNRQTCVFELTRISRPPKCWPTGTAVRQLAFDMVKRELIVATLQGEMSRISLSTRSLTKCAVSTGGWFRLARDGKRVALASNGYIRVLALPLGTEIAAFRTTPESKLFDFCFSPSGRYLAVSERGERNSLIRFFNLARTTDDPITVKNPSVKAMRMAFAQDDSALFTGDESGKIRRLVMANGTILSLGGFSGEIDCIEAGPDEKVFVSSGASIAALNSQTGRLLWTSTARGRYRTYSMAFAPRINALVAVDAPGNVHELSLDPPPTRPVVVRNHAGGSGVLNFHSPIELSEDGDVLSYGGPDHVTIEHLEGNQPLLSLDTRRLHIGREYPRLAVFSREIAIAAGGGGMLLWELKRGTPPRYTAVPDTTFLMGSADGAKLAIATRNSIGVFDLHTWKKIAVLAWHAPRGWTSSPIVFSPDGKQLAWSDPSGSLRLATLGPGHPVITPIGLKNASCVAFDGTGRLLAAGAENGTVGVWDLMSHRAPVMLVQGHDRDVISARFNRTGTRLATGGTDGRIRIWDLAKPTAEPVVLDAGPLPVTSLAFRSDGSVIAVNDTWSGTIQPDRGVHGGSYPWVREWPTTESLVECVCQKVWRNLTNEEWNRYFNSTLPYEQTCPTVHVSRPR